MMRAISPSRKIARPSSGRLLIIDALIGLSLLFALRTAMTTASIGSSAPDALSHNVTASFKSGPRATAQAREAYGRLEMSFEVNQGQAH